MPTPYQRMLRERAAKAAEASSSEGAAKRPSTRPAQPEPATAPAPAPAPATTKPAEQAAKADAALSEGLAALRARMPSLATPATQATPAKPAAPASPAIPGLNTPLGGLAGRAKSAVSAAISAKAAEVAAAKAEQEAQMIEASSVVVPDEIFQLPTELTAISDFPAAAVSADLATLYQRIQVDQPDIAGLLQRINQHMRQYEELAYLLSPEQLGLIFSGTMRVTGATITTTKKSAPKKDAAKELAASGLDFSNF